MALRLDPIRERLDLYERLMRLDKPIGILLLLWPTLWALWLSALGKPDWIVLWVFILGTVPVSYTHLTLPTNREV